MPARPSALFLSAESPYPMVGGGAMRSASILEYLRQHYDVDVVCFQQPEDRAGTRPEEHARYRSWTTLRLPAHSNSPFGRGIRNLGRLLRAVPPLVDRFRGFEDSVLQAMGLRRYAVAVIEHFWCAGYAETLRPFCDRMVLDLHNVESLWHRRFAMVSNPAMASIHRRFAQAAADLEQQLIPAFDLVLLTSAEEQAVIAKQLPNVNSVVVPNTLPPIPLPQTELENCVIFSGNMEYAPNRNAALYFSRNVWPILREKHPGLCWKVVGKRASALRNVLKPLERLQFVSDPEDAMIEIAKAKVAVVPLLFGTGTRLKIVEAWAAGCPVVSTPVGAEGLDYLDGRNILIADSASGFAEAVSKVLADRELARSLGEAGRSNYEESYCWAAAWSALATHNI